MKLKEWMKENKVTCTMMQDDLRYGRDYLYKIIGERMVPGKKLATVISEYTGGSVSLKDLGYEEKVKCRCPTCGKIM